MTLQSYVMCQRMQEKVCSAILSATSRPPGPATNIFRPLPPAPPSRLGIGYELRCHGTPTTDLNVLHLRLLVRFDVPEPMVARFVTRPAVAFCRCCWERSLDAAQSL